jgi:hypothetical protein
MNYNDYVKQNGGSVLHLDEMLVLQKEIREETVFWGSVYGSAFVEMPEKAFTSEAAYRTWCWKTTGLMPEKRTPTEFDKYFRPIIFAATERLTLAGTEYGVEVEDAIEECLASRLKTIQSVDNGADVDGLCVWVETIDDKRGPEVIIRINN